MKNKPQNCRRYAFHTGFQYHGYFDKKKTVRKTKLAWRPKLTWKPTRPFTLLFPAIAFSDKLYLHELNFSGIEKDIELTTRDLSLGKKMDLLHWNAVCRFPVSTVVIDLGTGRSNRVFIVFQMQVKNSKLRFGDLAMFLRKNMRRNLSFTEKLNYIEFRDYGARYNDYKECHSYKDIWHDEEPFIVPIFRDQILTIYWAR